MFAYSWCYFVYSIYEISFQLHVSSKLTFGWWIYYDIFWHSYFPWTPNASVVLLCHLPLSVFYVCIFFCSFIFFLFFLNHIDCRGIQISFGEVSVLGQMFPKSVFIKHNHKLEALSIIWIFYMYYYNLLTLSNLSTFRFQNNVDIYIYICYPNINLRGGVI